MPRRTEQAYLWEYNPDYFDTIQADHFDPEFWLQQQAVTGQERGRGTTYFIQHRGKHLVLRHYLRGGLVGRFIHDHYWFKSANAARSIHEYQVLEQLNEKGLPVPNAVAAQIKRTGCFYQADILVEQIANAEDLVKHLARPAGPEGYRRVYEAIGQMVALFHERGVYHADLNIKNILIDDQQKLWLIDFDRAQLDCRSSSKLQASLNRLKRSFEKETLRHHVAYTEQDWQSLERSYLEARRDH